MTLCVELHHNHAFPPNHCNPPTSARDFQERFLRSQQDDVSFADSRVNASQRSFDVSVPGVSWWTCCSPDRVPVSHLLPRVSACRHPHRLRRIFLVAHFFQIGKHSSHCTTSQLRSPPETSSPPAARIKTSNVSLRVTFVARRSVHHDRRVFTEPRPTVIHELYIVHRVDRLVPALESARRAAGAFFSSSFFFFVAVLVCPEFGSTPWAPSAHSDSGCAPLLRQ